MTKTSFSYGIHHDALPAHYPTHLHDATFWESLGRAVATFGFLEEVLARAIFAFTGTKPYSEVEVIEKAFGRVDPKASTGTLSSAGSSY